jgi:hypothetical protein
MPRTSQNGGGPIIPGNGRRPGPPSGLDKRERAIWSSITKRLPSDWLDVGAPLFRELCRHIKLGEDLMTDIRLARARIDELRTSEQPTSKVLLDATKNYRALLRLHALQTQQIGALSTKLRLTPQSRYQSSTAKIRASEEPEGIPLWEDYGLDPDESGSPDDGQNRQN